MKAQFSVEDAPATPVDGASEVPVLRVGGEIDTSNAADFEAQIMARLPAGGVVLDLTPVVFCDSAGFAALDRILATGHVTVALGHGNPVRKAASIMGLAVHDSVELAAGALGS